MNESENEFINSLRRVGLPSSLCESINEIRRAIFENEEGSDKLLIIMRGLSGSGKSTKARKLQEELGGKIFSTDDYPGLYETDDDGKLQMSFETDDDGMTPIVKAHKWNQRRAREAMEKGVSPVIIDNTNVQKWEAKPYVDAAKENGYNIAVEESDSEWKFDVEELGKRNAHGVPVSAIKKMLDRWETDGWDELTGKRSQKLYCFSARDFADEMFENGWTNDTLPPNVACIEICSTEDELENFGEDFASEDGPWFLEGEDFGDLPDNVLKVNFDDILDNVEVIRDGKFSRGITPEQATKIVKFIDKNIDKDFYIHCHAGLSRSQAVVQYILDTYPNHNWEVRSDNPPDHGLINQRVLAMLKQAAR